MLLYRCFDWRSALVNEISQALIRWYRQRFRLLPRANSRPIRSIIPRDLQELVRRMVNENLTWVQERIANELLLKLGLRVSPRTVAKHIPRREP